MVSLAYSEAATEVLAILDNTEIGAVNKIPKEFINFLKENSSKTYIPEFDYTKPIKELRLKPKTEALLGLIYFKYWADEEGKKEFSKKIKQNEEQYQKELREKYSVENLFAKKSSSTVVKAETMRQTELAIIPEQTLIQKIIKKIRNIFRR